MPRLSNKQKRTLAIIVALGALAILLPLCYRVTRPTEISIIVRDGETGEFLGDAVVEIQNSNGQKILDFVTRDDGTAGVKRLPIDDVGYRLEVRRLDYVPAVKRNVALSLHKTTQVRIPLRPKPGGRLYIGAEQAHVAVVDTASHLFAVYKRGPKGLRNWPVRHLVVHPEQPWVYLSARYVSYILEPTRLDAIAELSLPGAVAGLAMTRDGAELLTAVRRQGQQGVAVVDAGTGFEEAYLVVAPLPADWASISSSVASRYVVADLLVVETASGRMVYSLSDLVRQLGTPFEPQWYVLSPDQASLYAGSPISPAVIVVDVATRTILDSLEVGEDISAAAMRPDGSEIYLTNEELGLLMVVASDTGETLSQIPLGKGPVEVVVDPAGERAYIANAGSKDVSVMDIETRRIIRTIDLGLLPFSLAVR